MKPATMEEAVFDLKRSLLLLRHAWRRLAWTLSCEWRGLGYDVRRIYRRLGFQSKLARGHAQHALWRARLKLEAFGWALRARLSPVPGYALHRAAKRFARKGWEAGLSEAAFETRRNIARRMVDRAFREVIEENTF